MKFTEVEALTILKYLLEIKFDLVWEGKLRRDIMNRVERNPLEIGHFFEFLEIEKEKKGLDLKTIEPTEIINKFFDSEYSKASKHAADNVKLMDRKSYILMMEQKCRSVYVIK